MQIPIFQHSARCLLLFPGNTARNNTPSLYFQFPLYPLDIWAASRDVPQVHLWPLGTSIITAVSTQIWLIFQCLLIHPALSSRLGKVFYQSLSQNGIILSHSRYRDCPKSRYLWTKAWYNKQDSKSKQKISRGQSPARSPKHPRKSSDPPKETGTCARCTRTCDCKETPKTPLYFADRQDQPSRSPTITV